MKTKLFFLMVLMSSLFYAQSITTISTGIFYDGMGIDSNNNIYCSNYAGSQVYKYEYASGNTSVFKTGLTTPNGIGVNSNDEIYVCEATANRIVKYNTSGVSLQTVTGLNNPTGIKNIPGTSDMLWVSYNQSSINLMDSAGSSSLLIQGAPLFGPSGVAFIGNDVYISNYNDRKIFKFENNTLSLVAQLPATAAANNVLGFLTSKNGRLYATQIGENNIYKINPNTGVMTVLAGNGLGNDDGDVSVAQFNFPNGIIADEANDRIYISDAGTSNLRIINNVSLGINEFNATDIDLKLFPVPVSDSLNIQVNNYKGEKYTIDIVDASGKKIVSKEGKASNAEIHMVIDTQDWSSGAYYIRLIDDKSRRAYKQIIK